MAEVARTEPTEAQATSAFEAQEAIKATIRAMRVTWVRLAEQLYAFSEAKAWRALGYRSFEAWLSDPDIEINRRNAFYLIESWRELVVLRGVDPGRLEDLEVSKVREVMPAVRRGAVEIEDALDDVKALERDDLRQRYSGVGRPGGDPIGSAPLDADAEPEYTVCGSCGSRYRVARQAAA